MAQIQNATVDLVFETLQMTITDDAMPFAEVSAQVKRQARQINKEAMMLSWYNGRTGKGYPDYECGNQRPFWEMYADSRGSNLKIVVNDGDYVFYYLKL